MADSSRATSSARSPSRRLSSFTRSRKCCLVLSSGVRGRLRNGGVDCGVQCFLAVWVRRRTEDNPCAARITTNRLHWLQSSQKRQPLRIPLRLGKLLPEGGEFGFGKLIRRILCDQ